MMSRPAACPSLTSRRPRLLSACAVALLCSYLAFSSAALGDTQTETPATGGQQPSASATLEQCVAGEAQSERSAMFAGEVTAMPGSVRMAIRIEIQEQTSGEPLFHTVTASGLGQWRVSDPGVKAFKYNKQVTNLFAPASYRATVHFRWLNAKGRLMRSSVRRTLICRQPASTPYSPSASTEVTSAVG
jgi:hypothetical protein